MNTTKLPNIILADPPWRYDFAVSSTRKIENQYPTMETKDICNLKPKADKDAILFLWATNPKLQEALQVMSAWGFEYKTNIVWIKDRIGMGYYARSQHELLLIGTRGKFKPPTPENRKSSVIKGKRTKHSRKPPITRTYIEKMYPDGRYLEMFARDRRVNWGAWGNEVPKNIQHTISSCLSMENDFDKSLKFGLKGEELFKNNYSDIFISKLNHILFDSNKNKQLSGIDFEFESRKLKLDLKTRRNYVYKYNDILIETISVIENNKRGWFYTSKSDIIVYVWLNEEETKIIDGYIINLKHTRNWLKTEKDQYKTRIASTNSKSGIYHTENICIPIKDFPNNCLDRIKL